MNESSLNIPAVFCAYWAHFLVILAVEKRTGQYKGFGDAVQRLVMVMREFMAGFIIQVMVKNTALLSQATNRCCNEPSQALSCCSICLMFFGNNVHHGSAVPKTHYHSGVTAVDDCDNANVFFRQFFQTCTLYRRRGFIGE